MINTVFRWWNDQANSILNDACNPYQMLPQKTWISTSLCWTLFSHYRCTGLTMTGKALTLYFPPKLTVLEAICAHMIIFLNMLMTLLDKMFQLLKIPVQCFKMPFRWKHWWDLSSVHNILTLSWDTIKSRFALTKLGKPGESLFIFIVYVLQKGPVPFYSPLNDWFNC